MPDAAIEALGRRAIEMLDYYGIGEVEILRAHGRGRDYLIEINARPWLQYELAPASGHDFLGLLLDPEAPASQPIRNVGHTWIDFSADLYASFSREEGAVRAHGMSLAGYLASLARANVFARFAWNDPMPALDHLMRRARDNRLRHRGRPAGTSE
jgi:predicted ATP-grasp superfamily ATP-dependent carboligase